MPRGKKGKEVAESSRQATAHQNKRRAVDQDPEEEALERGPKPEWTSGLLTSQHEGWQAELFHDQMNALTQRKDAFICEKEVKGELFELFGIIEKFEALGWEAALRCYDGEVKTLFDTEIQEWVATLKCPPFNHPSKMRLIGTVNGIEVEMSFDTLRRVAKFDSKPANHYMYPNLDDLYYHPDKHPRWNVMLDTLFLPGTTHGKLYRKNLQIEAKLLLIICQLNVIPRRGDKVEVRYPEVPILYMLMKGTPLVPFRFLAMNNIWISRNSSERKIIPHCRLITALLKKYGAIEAGDRGSYKKSKPLDLRNLGPGWEYKETERDHRLKSEGQRWRELKDDAPPLGPGEEENVDSEEAPSGDDDYQDDANITAGGSGPRSGEFGFGAQSGYIGSAFDYAQQPYDQNWAHFGTMEQVVERRRPPTFSEWSDCNQMLFDHQTFMGASVERALKRNKDSQLDRDRAQVYAHEMEMNNCYNDDRNRRMRDDYLGGRPITPDPPIVDYTTLSPYDGSGYYHVPPLHHSQWVDPHTGQWMNYQTSGEGSSTQSQQAKGAGGEDEDSGAFGMGALGSVVRSIFGL
ncbi:hypothetical protein QVD17_24497 [Tagetes erecta]|uniref:Putative plant transposon protein domain-containing protein n=1 Tax=Tagetes erecta TaxID=13708 RepID=A0AAD8NUT0_TARER|nr:hypothetical protein QVD17_24497 [Tagetes erecta]